MRSKRNGTVVIAVVGGLIVTLILVLSTVWMGQEAGRNTERAVSTVSLLYLDELAGRREQVVESNLQGRVSDMQVAISLMGQDDLSDLQHMQAYQARMRQIYGVEKFAFVDTDGLIYTATGQQDNIGDYSFDYRTLAGPDISLLNQDSLEKKVVVAMPVSGLSIEGKELAVSFMEIGMQEMLSGVSMHAQENGATFCNIYTADGVALSNTVLGGLAVEDNLLEALREAEYDKGYSYEQVVRDFREGNRGVVSFTYDGIRETLAYVPVAGAGWQLTYLIRESVISQQISAISGSIINSSTIQSLVTVAVLLAVFAFIAAQERKNVQLTVEKEKADAANRVKQQEMQQRLDLQDQLLEEEKRRAQQDSMITAMASDYRSVYHVDLDRDEAVCYRSDPEDTDQYHEGDRFPFTESFTRYCSQSVAENYREGFMRFIRPESIREGLAKEPIVAYRYLARRAGTEYYEMIRVANAQPAKEGEDEAIHVVGVGFTVIDAEMRQSMAQQETLSEALEAAQQANKAKTAFLSSMSHEIRTPMNAIIGLDTIALNDPETPPKIKGYLTKMGSAADHLLALINDILDMSRIESGRMTLKSEEFSFPRMLEAVNTMFSGQCAEKGLDYHCHIEGQVDDWYVGDDMKLRQVLINILGNAVKFTPAGGSVSLSVARTAQFDGKSTLRFVIADTGIGMSKEFLPRIFDTFTQEDSSTTNRYGSSGLGMAITRSIVERMNGGIQVESEKGKGSTFTVTVTLTDSDRKDHQAEEIGDIRPEDLRVLIVDDDPVACEHAKLVLGKAGISAETASTGAEAVEKVRLYHARMEPYNLILMDWKMPEMDGVEATKQIRTIAGDESAIIILTAYRWDDVQEDALKAGVDSFLPKPLFAASVLEEFRTAIQRRGLAGQTKKTELAGRRILVAEDVEINAEIIRMVLQAREMEMDLAVNGRIAVETFAAHEPGYYSAILMDMRMPEMDGLQATHAIRAMGREDAKKIPIIALTANAFDEDVQRSMQAGLDAHLSKPVQPEVLYETLENLIR